MFTNNQRTLRGTDAMIVQHRVLIAARLNTSRLTDGNALGFPQWESLISQK